MCNKDVTWLQVKSCAFWAMHGGTGPMTHGLRGSAGDTRSNSATRPHNVFSLECIQQNKLP